ncbi:MAG: TonB-dependent receptor, partial [Candidatus Marinimicrobia bacterium]|nr:TonB-dependent receptor [Candidatus Neomarinimicrobiota bacterium]
VKLNYTLPFDLTAGVGISGKDKFYFSDSHDQQSKTYQLVDVNLEYTKENWSVSAWGKNVLDIRYAIRGFYFGLEPPNYEDKLYLHWGDPAQYGLSLKYHF